jgi:uncharacterized protein YjbJ (UPF0337 family)
MSLARCNKKNGNVTGNTNQQAKGFAKQIEGAFQRSMGDVEQAVDDSARKSRDTRWPG